MLPSNDTKIWPPSAVEAAGAGDEAGADTDATGGGAGGAGAGVKETYHRSKLTPIPMPIARIANPIRNRRMNRSVFGHRPRSRRRDFHQHDAMTRHRCGKQRAERAEILLAP